jgi:hypothetical protein
MTILFTEARLLLELPLGRVSSTSAPLEVYFKEAPFKLNDALEEISKSEESCPPAIIY